MGFDLAILLKLLAVAVLVLLNGFFVAAEFALVKIRDTQLNPFIAKGQRSALIARQIILNLDRYLSAAQLGITLASLGLGWVGEPVFKALLHPLLARMQLSESIQHYISFAVGFSVITFLHIVVGEQAPKLLAIQKPLPTTLWVARPMVWFYKISYPFIWGLDRASQWLLRRIGLEQGGDGEHSHSEEEMRLLLAEMPGQRGTDLGRSIVLNSFDLNHRSVLDVMRPRREIVFFSTEMTINECIEVAEKTRYSRYPLCENGNLDKALAVVHIKDLYAMRNKAVTAADLLPVARKLIYVPETARLEKLLKLFLDRKLHFAIVVDEYGGTVGVVALENILEELVGQIQDEFDQEKPLFERKDARTWEISGGLPLHELSELAGELLQEGGITTTSGWVTHKLGGFPKVGDAIALGSFDLHVEEMDGLRVARLKLVRREEVEASTGSD